MALRIGAMLNRYRIDGVLGQGRTGIVYRGFDTVIERTVAIKCLRADFQREAAPKESSRLVALLDEAKVIGQLNHPHITAVYDLGTTRGNSFIVMEYVDGETLKSRLAHRHGSSTPVADVLSFIVMVARALHYVHQRGILHGDIKPANVIATPQGTPKIMDFGIARRSRPNRPGSWSLAGEELIWGTPGYLAPEQLVEDEIDARADVFSLGVVAYEWLAGSRPFSGETIDLTLKAVLENRPAPLAEIGNFAAELSDAIDRALARSPSQRFASADAFADALELCQEHWLKDHPTHGTPSLPPNAPTEKLPRLPTRNLLFADFTDAELAEVMAGARQESYPAGETILQQGAGGSTMYVVVQGRVSVRIHSGSCDVEIKQIGAGEFFGEMAVVSQMPRSATVLALEPTELIAISGAVLRSGNPTLCLKLYRNIAALLSDRVRDVDGQVARLLESDLPAPADTGKLKATINDGKKNTES